MAGRRLLLDLALLLARVAVGAILVAHGWQKVVDAGLDGTAVAFDRAGVPVPTLSAYFAVVVELLGGIAIVLGLSLPLAGVLVAVDMAEAIAFLHTDHGVLVDSTGFELAVVIGASALLLAASGAGRIGLDHAFAERAGRRRRQ